MNRPGQQGKDLSRDFPLHLEILLAPVMRRARLENGRDNLLTRHPLSNSSGKCLKMKRAKARILYRFVVEVADIIFDGHGFCTRIFPPPMWISVFFPVRGQALETYGLVWFLRG